MSLPPDPTSPPRPSPVWPWLLGWLLLVVYFLTPPREVCDHSLDNSNYATYTRFFAERAQWGEDVLPMTGPYGFILYGQTYSGELFWLRLAGDLLLKAAFAVVLLHLFHRAGSTLWRWLWLGGVVWLVPIVDDLFHDFAILTATLCLLVNPGPRVNRRAGLSLGLLGLLALFKGTHLFTTTLCFGTVLLQFAVARDWRGAWIFSASYVGAVIAFWCLAGQNPANLPAYLHAVLELSAGYNATMGFDEPRLILFTGLTLAGGLVVVFLWSAARAPRSPRPVIVLLLLAGFSFIKWKHGFLRADGHVSIFFTSAGVIALTLGLVTFTSLLDGTAPVPQSTRHRRINVALFTALVGFSVISSLGFNLQLVTLTLAGVPAQLLRNIRFLAHPGHVRAALEEALAFNIREAHVPQIQNEITRGTVDFFGFEQGLLLLNNFNYHPRPMGGGSFSVFTPWLLERNERFVRDPRRSPAWQVMKLQTLDDRLPAADDALTLRAILQAYYPVLMQRDYLLLKRRATSLFPSPRLLETRPATPGESIQVPDPGPGQLLLFTLDAPLSLAGRLRSFLYRPPVLTARLVSRRQPRGQIFVLKPVMLQRPVILSPLLLDNSDVIDLYGPAPGNTVRTLELTAAPGFATGAFRLSFYSVPRPPAPEDGDINELKTYLAHPLFNRLPAGLVAPPTGIFELNKEPITSLHAPGSITWDLAADDQQLIFSYGMMPQTHLGAGNTDGVEVNVEVLWPPADGRILFKRMLRPLTSPADRGMQRARVYLPPHQAGAQLRIRIHPGPDHNANYDQAYVTRVQIKPGPLIPEQFNGLGVVPADGRLPSSSVAGIGARPVFLIHAPGEVVLNVPAGAQEMSCDLGLLPSAYEHGGATDGVGFTLSLLAPDGSRQVLATRYLDPVHEAADRGPQRLRLPLPATTGGAQIVITTAIGPCGDRSWDQSYVADVSFQYYSVK